MERKDMVLAALAAGDGASLSPVQVQKLFFLIDKKLSSELNGPHFGFTPYHYGPFDKAVYGTLEALEELGYVEILRSSGGQRNYMPTDKGMELGRQRLGQLPDTTVSYLRQLVHFVRSLTFVQLVSAIYAAYPEMRVNSIFAPAE